MKNLNFGQALEALKQGKHIKRKAWGGRWFLSSKPIMEDKLENGYTRSYAFNNGLIVAILANNGGCVPAQPYQADLLAEDWEVVG